jgi:hypothetical protein
VGGHSIAFITHHSLRHHSLPPTTDRRVRRTKKTLVGSADNSGTAARRAQLTLAESLRAANVRNRRLPPGKWSAIASPLAKVVDNDIDPAVADVACDHFRQCNGALERRTRLRVANRPETYLH